MGTGGSAARHQRRHLHVCASCRRPFVVPEAVLEVLDGDRYVIELGCTNCGWSEVGVHGDEALERLDRELDRTTAELRAALDAMVVAAELDRIDRFAAALRRGDILPEDF